MDFARYSMDVQVPGMRYGAVLRAPVEGSEPATIDKQEAARSPGVIDVIRLPYGVGVLAHTPEAAFAGKDRLKVTWSKANGEPFNSAAALERYVERAKDLVAEGKAWDKAGDIAAMSEAKTTVEAEYRTRFRLSRAKWSRSTRGRGEYGGRRSGNLVWNAGPDHGARQRSPRARIWPGKDRAPSDAAGRRLRPRAAISMPSTSSMPC